MIKKFYIKGFDGLRGISVILVLLTHLGIYNLLPDDPFFRNRVWNLFSGLTGVYIFFCISGFLITTLLLFEKKKSKISLKKFYIRRFLRLSPPLAVLLFIILILMLIGFIVPNYRSFFLTLFYVYNFVPRSIYTPELGHTWSLGVEEQFYLIWPIIISKFKTVTIVILSILIFLLCIFVPKLLLIGFAPDYFTERWFIPAVAPIIVGSLLGILVFESKQVISSFYHGAIYPFLFSLILFFSPIYVSDNFLSFAFIIQSLGIANFLVWIYFNQKNIVVSILEWGPLAYIGKISYSVYVFQGLFLRTGPGGEFFFQLFPYNIFLTFVMAILSYHLMEKRIVAFKDRFFGVGENEQVETESVSNKIRKKDLNFEKAI